MINCMLFLVANITVPALGGLSTIEITLLRQVDHTELGYTL